jgi:hypothetical protein
MEQGYVMFISVGFLVDKFLRIVFSHSGFWMLISVVFSLGKEIHHDAEEDEYEEDGDSAQVTEEFHYMFSTLTLTSFCISF